MNFGTTTLSVNNLSATGYVLQNGDPAFLAGTTYYWRVVSTDSLGNATISPANNFKVRSKTILYDLAIGTSHGGLTPSFTGSDAVLVKENIAVPTYTVPSSQPLDEIGLTNSSDRYFWRVTAKDEAGNSVYVHRYG